MQNPFQTDANMDAHMMDVGEAAETIVEEEKPEVGLELHVGSNIFRATNGVIKFQGKEQIVLEVQPDPPSLMLTMDFYDEAGQRIGHLRRNQLSAVGASRFAVGVTAPPDPTLDDPLTVHRFRTGNRQYGGRGVFVPPTENPIYDRTFSYPQRRSGVDQPTLLPPRHRFDDVR